MINEQIMVDTVKRMLEAGIDEPTILSTLVDTGLTQEEANLVLGKVKTPSPSAPQQGTFTQPQAQDIALMKSQIQTQAETQELSDTSVHNKLDAHEQKIDDVAKTLNEVKQVVSTAPSGTVDSTLSYRISALEQKLEDVSSTTKATLELMKNVLETNRKILTELEAKK